jgi:hypothetical protein
LNVPLDIDSGQPQVVPDEIDAIGNGLLRLFKTKDGAESGRRHILGPEDLDIEGLFEKRGRALRDELIPGEADLRVEELYARKAAE